MKLLEATAVARIDVWAAGRQPAWSADERSALRVALMALSDAVTPHLVADVPLADAEVQRFVLQRAQDALDDALIRAAAGMRRAIRIDAPVARTRDGRAALNLRSASIAELDALPGIGRERARDLARALAWDGGIDRIASLDAVEGVGPALLETLQAEAQLDAPWTALVSPALLHFCREPTVEHALRLFERSDLEFFHGDNSRLERHPPAGGSPAARLLRLLRQLREQAEARLSPLSGALASQAQVELTRAAVRARYLEALQPADGEVLVDAAYRDAMLEMIGGAQQSLDLAVFLATASRHRTLGIGSEDIVAALEARVAAGIAVRVLVDRDLPDDPYRSGRINAPLVARLRAAGVQVKQDEREVLLHSKFLVADRRRAIVGSHNLTTASIAHTHELSVRLDEATVASAFAARFDALWAALP